MNELTIAGGTEIVEQQTINADLWDGKFGGKTERLTMEFDTLEEAQKAVAEVEAVHTPTGKRISSASGAVCIIDDIAWAE